MFKVLISFLLVACWFEMDQITKDVGKLCVVALQIDSEVASSALPDAELRFII